ncbi:hypothetical protein CY0110_18562 [Crocosphaera chwakensis CCY0110]|uniref:Uncharacterized protein n=1 Tax=Crocosphaera chwakensis CCY0110 TaxID=391612 RepID=A3IJ44_9CHRO|nr:hypothetical protein CY0110_18562 [Crocosphaera chwakensis CCY0110]
MYWTGKNQARRAIYDPFTCRLFNL